MKAILLRNDFMKMIEIEKPTPTIETVVLRELSPTWSGLREIDGLSAHTGKITFRLVSHGKVLVYEADE